MTVGVTGAGLVASRWVRSPQQLIADQQPPGLTTITAPVERRVLKDTVVLRGKVQAGQTVDVTPTPRSGDRAVVTAVRVKAGQSFSAGSVMLEVAGRPLFAFPGSIPAYRDLHPGASGRDVAQLQAALKSLGFDPDETAGELGQGTKDALTSFYLSRGYHVLVDGDLPVLNAARDRVRGARRALADAQAELDRLRTPTSPGPSQSPASPSPTSSNPGRLDEIARAQRQVEYAKEDLESANAALAELERTTGPMLPLSEVVFLPQLPARVEKLKAVVGADVTAPLITLSGGALAVVARLNPGQRALVKPTMPVEIYSEVLGTSATGTVSSIGELEADETGTRSHAMVVEPSGGPLDAKYAGQDVRLTVATASTDGEVLVVPVSALFAGADGRTAVFREDPDGKQVRVLVTAGVSGDGYIAVTPIEGTLQPDDRVVVGSARGTGG
ncbi:hypothetical protein ABZS66_36235 [Dactylosporangium sp. NPDC005572]|uniref:hypothetical protein n=1 Tax=Dactylosporangium sp. NPDC005572 TaxID=3156889 RepID=UPI0033B4FB10